MDKLGTLNNVVSINGQLYQDNRSPSQLARQQYSTLRQSKLASDPEKYGYVPMSASLSSIIGGSTPSGSGSGAGNQPPSYTPNPFTQGQLNGAMGRASVPQWMMDAYSRKIGSMGGNANNPPFAVNQTGFPGVAGKSAQGGQL